MDGCEGIENRGGSPGPLAAARSLERDCDESLLSATATGRGPALELAVEVVVPTGRGRRRVQGGGGG